MEEEHVLGEAGAHSTTPTYTVRRDGPARRTGSSIKKFYKGHSQDPPTLVVKCKETLSRDVTWLRSIALWRGRLLTTGCPHFLRPVVTVLAGDVSCGAAAAGGVSEGAGPGRGPQPAVWRGAAVLRRLWPPSPCRGAAPCGLCLVAGGGWLVLLLRGCAACRAVGGCSYNDNPWVRHAHGRKA